jgi:hypothetical protein
MCADDRFLCQRYPVLWIPASAGMTLKGFGEAHSTKFAIDPRVVRVRLSLSSSGGRLLSL